MVVEAVDLVGVAEGAGAVGAEYCAPVLGEEYSTSFGSEYFAGPPWG